MKDANCDCLEIALFDFSVWQRCIVNGRRISHGNHQFHQYFWTSFEFYIVFRMEIRLGSNRRDEA